MDSLLIPVDFSSISLLACRVGFQLAAKLNAQPLVLYVYTAPYLLGTAPDTPFPSLDDNVSEIENAEMENDMRAIAERQLDKFKAGLDNAIANGEMPSMAYKAELAEGVPEDVILNYTRQNPPVMVVMATRGKQKKEKELIGSVTAEVIDSCKVPVFTVPENYDFEELKDIRRLAFFVNLDGKEDGAFKFFMEMFGNPEVNIMLVPASDKISDYPSKISALSKELSSLYPKATFRGAPFPTKEFRTEFENILKEFGLEMLIVPNRHRNVFARLFNPSIPHKILFERDIPMLALPC